MAKVVQRIDYATGATEGIESLLARFKDKVAKDGILKDLRSHEFYIPKSEKLRLKSEEARRARAREEKKAQNARNKKKRMYNKEQNNNTNE